MDYKIKTARLLLEQPQIKNTEELYQLMHFHVNTEFLTWEAHTTVKTTNDLLISLIEAQKQGKGYHWCIYFNNKIIGIISLIDVRRQIRTWTINRAELSYWIGTPFTRKGFATEAAQAVLEFGFKRLSLHKIIIAHAVDNIESKRICDKLGFKQYAHEKEAFMKNNTWHDLIWYDMII